MGGVTIRGQEFAESTKEPGFTFALARFDGILGMAFHSISVQGVIPPFYHMVERDLIDEPIFSFYLGKESDNGEGDEESELCGGELVLGGVDPAHFVGDIHWSPIRRQGYWEIELQDIKFNGEYADLGPMGAAIDTGSSLIVTPTTVAELINRDLGAEKNWAGQYIVDCNAIDDLPEFCMVFSGKEFCLTAQDYILQVQGQCISGFMGMDIGKYSMIAFAIFFFFFYNQVLLFGKKINKPMFMIIIYTGEPAGPLWIGKMTFFFCFINIISSINIDDTSLDY